VPLLLSFLLGSAKIQMTDNVLSHNEMCRREDVSLQRGMNLGLRGDSRIQRSFLVRSS